MISPSSSSRRRCAVLALLFAAGAIHCGSDAGSSATGDDAGPPAQPTKDSGAPAHDASTPHPDGGASGHDASVPPAHDASTPVDANGPPIGGPQPTACTTPPCINVLNHCPFPIWIHAASNDGTVLAPDNAQLGAGGAPDSLQQFNAPASWNAARVNAFWDDPTSANADPNAYEKVEVTIANGTMNYNITYVDYMALPSKMEAIDPSCTKSGGFDPAVACPIAVAGVASGCPAGLLDGKRCLSAGAYCSVGANKSSAFCHALDSTLATCEQQNASTCGIASSLADGTPNVYGCAGYFDSQPPSCSPASTSCHLDGTKWCAALNRGMLAQPESGDSTQYYQTAPYNTYAKWVHETCPGIYAFPYDDYPSSSGQSGFRSCTAGRLDITFCPGG
ncbi:MAG TPA: beta-1,3-glucanase family protein [Polyangiaceae bacterium]